MGFSRVREVPSGKERCAGNVLGELSIVGRLATI